MPLKNANRPFEEDFLSSSLLEYAITGSESGGTDFRDCSGRPVQQSGFFEAIFEVQ
jgi:hypothetical protein